MSNYSSQKESGVVEPRAQEACSSAAHLWVKSQDNGSYKCPTYLTSKDNFLKISKRRIPRW
jgi:hypothetical protein